MSQKKILNKIVLGALLFSSLTFGGIKLSQALFSDVETLATNTAGAATVNLKLGGEDPTQIHFDMPNLMPGAPVRSTIGMTDIGTGSDFTENLYIDFILTGSDEGVNSEAETDAEGEGELDDCIMIRASYLDGANEIEVMPFTSLADLTGTFIDEASNSLLDQALQISTVNLNLDFSADACDNAAMGDNIAFDLAFYYEQ